MRRFNANRFVQLFVIAIYASISLTVSADITDGNPIPAGSIHLQCWQYGVKIIDEKELHEMTASSLKEPGTMSFRREADLKSNVLVVPTSNGICLVKSKR